MTWKAVFVGVPAMAVVNFVPVLGLLVSAAFFLTVFGVLYQRFWLAIRSAF